MIAFLDQNIDHTSLVTITDLESSRHHVCVTVIDYFDRPTSHVNFLHLVPAEL